MTEAEEETCLLLVSKLQTVCCLSAPDPQLLHGPPE